MSKQFQYINHLRQKKDLKKLKSFLRSVDTIYAVQEPIENFTNRSIHDLPLKWLTHKHIYCCNFRLSNVYPFTITNFPLFWACNVDETVSRDMSIGFNDKKRFITLIWTQTKIREEWYKFINKYNGFYNFNFINQSNLEISKRWRELPKEYLDSIWEFGIESGSKKTYICYECITEKTFRPLYFGKPFLVYGAPGMYKALKSYGITLSPYINYKFDENIDNRWELFCNEVKKLIHDNDIEKHLKHAKYNQTQLDKIISLNQNTYNRLIDMFYMEAQHNDQNKAVIEWYAEEYGD